MPFNPNRKAGFSTWEPPNNPRCPSCYGETVCVLVEGSDKRLREEYECTTCGRVLRHRTSVDLKSKDPIQVFNRIQRRARQAELEDHKR